ncbi:hypothetical protein LOTGIDRAFT_169525 [Lottia gigantea]|uniref:SUEL-type lectin domain-containing protein n=1 Tax=Lottia gigantea TaxID=225164 RepID=V3ZQX9_LOTGI|nr:hypothetical protein LOTGIDRAFT_169525 [Lottia gigantea]ESO83301.1 hypothetical protein LOTGIDRAFT_169525 [Lottia gigantea]
MKTLLSVIAVVLAALTVVNGGSQNCVDPPHNIINKNYNTNLENVTTVQIRSEYIKTRRYRVAGDTSCKAGGRRYGKHAVCPVYYVLNTDVNRIPQRQYEQICSCSSPPTSDGGVSLVECRAVIKHLPVLRRTGCAGGIYNFTLTLEAFQTGCETVQPNIRYVPVDTPKSPE